MNRFVWILTHFEFLGSPRWLDEVVCRVASSRSRALRLLHQIHVEPGTWWGLRSAPVDDLDGEPGRQEFFSSTGRKMRRGYTLKRALLLNRAFRAQKKKGGTKKSPSRPS